MVGTGPPAIPTNAPEGDAKVTAMVNCALVLRAARRFGGGDTSGSSHATPLSKKGTSSIATNDAPGTVTVGGLFSGSVMVRSWKALAPPKEGEDKVTMMSTTPTANTVTCMDASCVLMSWGGPVRRNGRPGPAGSVYVTEGTVEVKSTKPSDSGNNKMETVTLESSALPMGATTMPVPYCT